VKDRLFAVYLAGEYGARKASREGAALVVVDAFRASTTIAVLVRKGAHVVPVTSVEEDAHAEVDYYVGERGSAKVAGFDFGNSPTEVALSELSWGARVVLSTTNGTRIIQVARGAPAILAGAFANAYAVADKLAGGIHGARVAAIDCGWEGCRSGEDEFAAGAILYRLQDKGAKFDERAKGVVDLYLARPTESLRQNSAARLLKCLGYEKDLDFCLAENTVLVVPRLMGGVFVG
jgi:2-phosphosulfolactate phosphatase